MSADLVAAQSDELISILEQLPEGVFVLDADSRVVFANKPGMRLVKMKPKKTLSEVFPFPVEEGTMRDFDVEMMVKPMTWGGQTATLIHLKPLKSAGAFHLEWKLESALEKARSAEIMLEEWKSREGLVAVTEAPGGAQSAELERSIEESREQLAVAQLRETGLVAKVDEYHAIVARQRQEFDDRIGELESLLELAETRADELQNEVVSGDHQTATELQHAVALARETEEHLRAVETELAETRERIRVAEEQAEVAEERAYSLETELERLEGELAETVAAEEVASLSEELASWRARADESAAEAQRLQAELTSAREEQTGALSAREEEISDLVDRLESKEEELVILTDRAEAKEEEIASLVERLATTEQEAAAQGGRSSAKDGELAALNEKLEAKNEELVSFTSVLEVRQTELVSLADELQAQGVHLAGTTAQLRALEEELQEKDARLESVSADAEAFATELESLRAALEEASLEGTGTTEALTLAEVQLETMRQRLEAAEDTLRVRSEESDELAEQLRAETEQSEELAEQLRQENELLQESLREQGEELEGVRQVAESVEGLAAELALLQATHGALSAEKAAVDAVVEEVVTLRARVAELEGFSQETERLQKELQKVTAQLEEAGALAEKGERADKLERKLEGALRRAEEAEERLQEERRLLAELRQTSERRISELESRQSSTPAGAGAGEMDPETERLAFQDSLTGLPNRHILHRYLSFMLKQSVRYERYTALLRIDCDKFKTVSDNFGTEFGDRLIRSIGERLSAVVRGSDVLGRLGEDEFVILLSELTDQKEASAVTASVIKRIYQLLKKPFSVDDQAISVGVSMGVSLYPLDATNGEQMFQHAAAALKRAKEIGGGQAQYFTPEVQSSHETRSKLDQELKLGLERGEFGLLYQPIFELSNRQIVGVEALIRWNHPNHGALGPDEFLKVAEESGIIVLIGNWALRSAVQRAAQWQQAGLNLFVSLNLSRRQLLEADLIAALHTAMVEFRCSPDRILLEISEELTGPELPRLRDTLANLQQLGVRLAVDNFGTSASSLQELGQGPFGVLKIDRRFVHGIPAQKENAGIVLSALHLGIHLGLITIAVGVETEMERDWLSKAGCRYAQGNLLAAPLPAEHVGEVMSRR